MTDQERTAACLAVGSELLGDEKLDRNSLTITRALAGCGIAWRSSHHQINGIISAGTISMVVGKRNTGTAVQTNLFSFKALC